MTSRMERVMVLVLFIQTSTADFLHPKQTKDRQFEEVFVSQKRGVDRSSCGTELEPCKSISMGVSRADYDAQIYVDGTGTETSPYPCQSSNMQYQGIYVNKSLSLIGIQSVVNVKCRDGLGITFNHSDLNHNKTAIKLINISLIESPINARDVNLDIDSCTFIRGLSAITLTRSTKSVKLSFTNSSCLNTSSCIIVDALQISKQRSQQTLLINITNSNVTGTFASSPTLPSRAIGLHVVSSDRVNPGSIICDISLQSVTFNDNSIGSKGVIYVEWLDGFSSLHLDHIVFFGNKIVSRSPPNMIFIQSYAHEVLLEHTTFSISTLGRALKLNATTSSKLNILNSYFTGELGSPPGSVGVIYLTSDHQSDVYIGNTHFLNIHTGGIGSCMYLTSRTARVQVEDSKFMNNRGGCAGIFWLATEELLITVIQGCHFEAIGSDGPGGLASCLGKVVNITMLDSKVNGSHALGPGGIFDIGLTGCGRPKKIMKVYLRLKSVSMQHTSCKGPGGVAVLDTLNGLINVQNSLFSNIAATGPGGVLSASFANPSNAKFSFYISNSIFKNSGTFAPGGIIMASNCLAKLVMEEVTIDSAIAHEGPGGGLNIEGNDYMEISINNCIFKKCLAESAPGGILYIVTDKPLLMSISNSVFTSSATTGPGGCIYMDIVQSNISLTNVTFSNCQSFIAPAGAMYIVQSSLVHSKLTLKSCVLLNNTARGSVGGALALSLPKDNISNPGCIKNPSLLRQPTPRRTWTYTSKVEFISTLFINNTAQRGGALSLSRGQHVFQDCSFLDNFAKLQGGHVLSYSDSTSLQMYNTTFLQTRKTQILNVDNNKMSFSTTSFIDIDSEGPLMLINSTLKSKPLGDVKPLVMVSQGGFVSFGENNKTSLICPRGSNLEVINVTDTINTEYKSDKCSIILSVLQFNCQSCPLGTYSLQYGRRIGLHKTGDFQCLPCPFGAECQHNIAAKENYWGYKVQQSPPTLNFINCPVGYCKHPDKQDQFEYNSCQGSRSGVLCGHCKEDYTETLLSPSCRRKDKCNDTWLWGVAFLMLLFMALYLVHKPRLSIFFKTQIFWFKKDISIDEEVPSFDAFVKTHDNGYLKIVFYFYQVANLLLISTSYDRVVETQLLQPVVGFFNFQFRFSTNGFLCPFPGLTVVTKELLLTCQVFGVSIMIMFCYFCHYLFHKCRSRPLPNLGPYFSALLETMLLGYAVFAYTALKLLRCTSTGEESRLFIAGQVLCYQWWQYFLMVFVGVVVVPFILIIGLGSYWLDKRTISVKRFLLACALPLPYLVYRLARFLFCPLEQQPEEPDEWKRSIKNVLYGPFRPSEGDSYGALYWESVLITRRLILIIIYVSFSDPLSKQLLLTFVCVGILFHHSVVLPFRKRTDNAAEMASLLALVAIGIINISKASFLSYGQVPEGPLHSFADILEWIQAIILSIVPLVCSSVIIVFAFSQVVRLFMSMGLVICSWIYARCCNRYFTKENKPLLQPNIYSNSTKEETFN